MPSTRVRTVRGLAALAAAALFACASQNQPTEPTVQQRGSTEYGAIEYVETGLRPGARQGFVFLRAEKPRGSVILFSGGDGVLHLRQRGTLKGSANFLLRVRMDFVAAGYNVAAVDTPSDQSSLKYFRTTSQHAQDIEGVIQYLRSVNPGPVWLIGTSRGTVSATNVASRLPQANGGPDGMVLTSSITIAGGGPETSVYNTDLGNIRIPVLVVSHESDSCFVSPMSGSKILVQRLKAETVADFLTFAGGSPPESGSCEPFSPHGYFGIESQVTQAIIQWMKEHEAHG